MSDEEIECKRFITIGEISKILDVKQYIIRFWEKKFSQITPIKRRGRRLYDQKNVAIIKQIKMLIYEKGYTIKGVQLKLSNMRNNFNDGVVISLDDKTRLSDILKELTDLRNYLVDRL